MRFANGGFPAKHRVASIALGELKVLRHWADAPPGGLVQATTKDDKVFIGMRCEMEIQASGAPFLLVLDGDERGFLVAGETLRPEALDVSALVEVRIKDPCPKPYAATDRDHYGIVCEAKAGSGCFIVRARPVVGPDWFVFLTNWAATIPIGAITSKLDLSQLCVLGPTEVAPIARPTLVSRRT
jgi:hypothetical protein